MITLGGEGWDWEVERGISVRRNSLSKTLRHNGIWFEEMKQKDLYSWRLKAREWNKVSLSEGVGG